MKLAMDAFGDKLLEDAELPEAVKICLKNLQFDGKWTTALDAKHGDVLEEQLQLAKESVIDDAMLKDLIAKAGSNQHVSDPSKLVPIAYLETLVFGGRTNYY